MNKHWGAAFCSIFVVGLGQALKGHGGKAVNLLLIFYFVIPGLIYLALAINGYLFLLVFGFLVFFGLLVWLYNIWDALVKA